MLVALVYEQAKDAAQLALKRMATADEEAISMVTNTLVSTLLSKYLTKCRVGHETFFFC